MVQMKSQHSSALTAALNYVKHHAPQLVYSEISEALTQPAQPNEFNPDWDSMAVMVEEQQRMAKRIEELEAMLEQKTARLVDAQARIAALEKALTQAVEALENYEMLGVPEIEDALSAARQTLGANT